MPWSAPATGACWSCSRTCRWWPRRETANKPCAVGVRRRRTWRWWTWPCPAYVTKSSPPELLVQGVRQVHGGQRLISPDLASEVAALLLTPDALSAHHLSPREFEVLRSLVGGRTPQQIAEALSLSVKTVHNLHYQIKTKLGTGNDFELARLAWQNGWVV
jgi:DNA-binding NarL/FixJ family response regulator